MKLDKLIRHDHEAIALFAVNFILIRLLVFGLFVGGMTGCHTTQHMSQSVKDFSGFLGDYSMLKQGKEGEANYIYIDLSAPWKQYTEIYSKPSELWISDEPDSALGSLSHQNQQLLASYLQTALVNALEKNFTFYERHFTVADRPGPGVLVIHAAMTEGRKSKPVSLVSSIIPIDLALSYDKQTISGAGTGVGLIMIEAEFTDGGTGQRVAAVVDARAGTKALHDKLNSTWGDVKLADDWWAERLAYRLELLKEGKFSDESL